MASPGPILPVLHPKDLGSSHDMNIHLHRGEDGVGYYLSSTVARSVQKPRIPLLATFHGSDPNYMTPAMHRKAGYTDVLHNLGSGSRICVHPDRLSIVGMCWRKKSLFYLKMLRLQKRIKKTKVSALMGLTFSHGEEGN